MILFIDDEPGLIELYVQAVRDRGLETLLLTSISEVTGFLSSPAENPSCIVLDIMFPADKAMPRVMTSEGLTAVMPLFASLRSHFPKSPVVVFTNSSSIAAKQFFQDQDNCLLYYKTDLLPDELADVVL